MLGNLWIPICIVSVNRWSGSEVFVPRGDENTSHGLNISLLVSKMEIMTLPIAKIISNEGFGNALSVKEIH